jgi:hypothetical protein
VHTSDLSSVFNVEIPSGTTASIPPPLAFDTSGNVWFSAFDGSTSIQTKVFKISVPGNVQTVYDLTSTLTTHAIATLTFDPTGGTLLVGTAGHIYRFTITGTPTFVNTVTFSQTNSLLNGNFFNVSPRLAGSASWMWLRGGYVKETFATTYTAAPILAVDANVGVPTNSNLDDLSNNPHISPTVTMTHYAMTASPHFSAIEWFDLEPCP